MCTLTPCPIRNVFLGLALDKKGKDDESEKAYRAAIARKSNDSLAWQGLITLFEKQGGKMIDAYGEAAIQTAEISMQVYVAWAWRSVGRRL